jgi:leucine dehydrogenase
VTPTAIPRAEPSTPPLPDLDHEQILVRRGPRSRVQMAIAIHSTVLGPALGGVRLWGYPAPMHGVADAMRLARAMTYKAAAAGLDLGGGKGVICAPTGTGSLTGGRRRAILRDFADLVESLGGRYVTAEDVGTGAEDMVAISERTRHVTGLPVERGGSGDPSPLTAIGVAAAIRASAAHRLGSRELAGLRVSVVGLGHVGEQLAWVLAQAGATLTVSDIDPSRRAVAEELGAIWAESADAMLAGCDVLVPCALGSAVDRSNFTRLNCAILCGAANNQLADEGLAVMLAERGILYAPDFIANAGGLISVYRELRGYGADRARELALGIEETMTRILSTADERRNTPLAAARELALERLAAAGDGAGVHLATAG